MDGALEIFIGDLKKIRVGSYDKKLQVMADAWIFNGFNLLPGIIDYICELGYVVNYTDFDISNSSFICFNKRSEQLLVKLCYRSYMPDRESSIVIISNGITKEYFCFFNGENVFLLLDSVSSVKNGETIYIYKRKEVENENKFFSMKRVKKICFDK